MRQGLNVAEAREWIEGATPVLSAERVGASEALGRVLFEPVVSTRRIPPADCSAMDGYAVRRADLAGAGPDDPVELRVAYEVAAGGRALQALARGEVARIFTGAPLPEAADAVVKQEDTREVGGGVRFLCQPEPREHVRDAGEDIDVGDVVLDPGCVIRPSEIGVLASLGRSLVAVHRRARVAILSGGDELVEVDGDVSGGRIVSSNSYTLFAQCRAIGADPIYLGISRDRPESVEQQFRAALHADCIVSSAGVSVGDHDHVRSVLEKLGCRLEFWGVNMKPGYPLAFGRFEAGDSAGGLCGALVFGLPGNPVSASVTFEQFVRPTLLRMMGHTRCFRPTLQVRVGETLRKKAGRLHFVRITLEEQDGEWVAHATGSQSSGVMRSLTQADGLLVFPLEATELAEGARATVQILDDGFFAAERAGF
ncbi:MAG: molybdopterin molybdotransferase MoeA [Deltaproteobacteria bacterium]|nr:molybdopterin molybdotransferase MoeA [Deltaproteobacteria bacterium]MBW2384011.1 molybdopterin molybdotransferase MoeA [Deltaproteobacteria bacterium]MBW2696134.1 molybdopterin molybdotransferase MoeA [Deltaproteobacteria bacterium]